MHCAVLSNWARRGGGRGVSGVLQGYVLALTQAWLHDIRRHVHIFAAQPLGIFHSIIVTTWKTKA